MNVSRLLLPALALALLSGASALAQVPITTSYQGYLENGGAPVNDPAATLTFRLYNVASGGTALWTETKTNVAIADGVFAVALGTQTPLVSTLFDGVLYLSTAVGGAGAPELSPRTVLRAAPYARTLTAPARVKGTPGNNESVLRVEDAATSANSTGLWVQSASTNGTAVYGNATGASGITDGIYGRAASPSGRGVVGIAASTTGLAYGVRGETASSGGHGVSGNAYASSGTTYGVYGHSASSQGTGVYGVASATSGSTYGVSGEASSTHGVGVFGKATATSGTNYGVRGENTSSEGFGVYGLNWAGTGVHGISASTTGRGVFGFAGTTSGVNYGVYAQSASSAGYGLYATNSAGGVAARFTSRTRFDGNINVYDGGAAFPTISLIPSGGAQVVLNRNNVAVLTLDADYNGDSRVITQELEITGGSDLAEPFDVALHPEVGAPVPGMVVAIDPHHAGRLTVAATPYDPLVAGVVSGAGGVEPGLMMGQRGSVADGDTPVALVGRVYVLVDAAYGAVRPGDLLTTSATPGHAMRASDRERAEGAVLGKAMTGLESGRGLVLVLVGLQ